MADIESILAVVDDPANRPSATARILVDHSLEQRRSELAARLNQVSDSGGLSPSKQAVEVAKELRAVEAEIDAALVEFRFVAVGKRAWSDMLAKHPPTKQQRERDPRLDHNPDTFPIAAIAASCAEPEMTVEQVRRLDEALSLAQFSKLWDACLEANIGGDVGPKSVAAGLILRANELYATTAVSGESLAASSSDES